MVSSVSSPHSIFRFPFENEWATLLKGEFVNALFNHVLIVEVNLKSFRSS